MDPSWSLSDDPCSSWAPWAGISCDVSGDVTALSLQALALAASNSGGRLLPLGSTLPLAALGSLTKLTLLNLERAGLSGVLEDAGQPGVGLAQLTGLTSLKLGYQSVSCAEGLCFEILADSGDFETAALTTLPACDSFPPPRS